MRLCVVVFWSLRAYTSDTEVNKESTDTCDGILARKCASVPIALLTNSEEVLRGPTTHWNCTGIFEIRARLLKFERSGGR